MIYVYDAPNARWHGFPGNYDDETYWKDVIDWCKKTGNLIHVRDEEYMKYLNHPREIEIHLDSTDTSKSKAMLKEYRCTRNAPYTHECIGQKDISARQGYYVKANSEQEALENMSQRFPDEIESGFTVEEW